MAEAQQGQYEVILREKVCTQFPPTHEGVPIPHIWIYLPKDRIQTKKICILLVLVIALLDCGQARGLILLKSPLYEENCGVNKRFTN
ncbi:hypothetical protein BDV30DRAFT_187582 [Aspergillus minisclerotigenes]|uniref:Uncharacterized protein n=1 Tax=Aspergillus minisclerotigenes TaxID=656917 RepID=A0A5N6ISM0_9EURO|nr:hypothetical protein BDV30DRAFT_187582 [Aspergillus minisclerotigenes]